MSTAIDLTQHRAQLGAAANDWIPNPGPQTRFLACGATEVLYGGAAGGGKALDVDTPVPTPSGWSTMGALKAGDELFDERGQVCRVTKAFDVMGGRPCFEVLLSDGSRLVADADHLWVTSSAAERSRGLRSSAEWRTKRRNARPSRGSGKRPDLSSLNAQRDRATKNPVLSAVRTTAELAATVRVGARLNHSIALAMPLVMPTRELPIDPYVLGVWLGDGTTAGGTISSADLEIIDELGAAGYAPRRQAGPYAGGTKGLHTKLRLAGLLGDKHIPAGYLRASHLQRLALLQGLMDTDGGSYASGACEFTTTLPALRDGMAELLTSLGVKVTTREGRAVLNGRVIGPRWTFKFLLSSPAFRLSRKAARQKTTGFRGTHLRRYITSIVPVPSRPVRCIEVDSPSHCYLVGRAMVPTHNSEALLVSALRRVQLPGYKALLLRREFPELRRTLLARSSQLYPHAGGVWRAQDKAWHFPSGATIELGSAPHETSIARYQGGGYAYIGFDELTHFTYRQYTWLFSRLRSSGIELRIRGATNPGSKGHDWVKRRWAAWLFKPGELGYDGPYAQPGEVLHFRSLPDSDIEEICAPDDPEGTSRTFFPAKYSDTPQLASGYSANLNKLSLLDRKRQRDGDWQAREVAGEFFKRIWFEILDAAPIAVVARVRYWDLAGTEARKATPSSAFTAGPLMSITASGLVYVEHVERGQWSPGEVFEKIKKTAGEDLERDPNMITFVERDPAQAGKFQAWWLTTMLPEIGLKTVAPHGDKLTRASMVSSQAEVGNVKVLRGAWTEAFLSEAEDFPEKTKDQIDGLSGGYRQLIVRWKLHEKRSESAKRVVARPPRASRETSDVGGERATRGGSMRGSF